MLLATAAITFALVLQAGGRPGTDRAFAFTPPSNGYYAAVDCNTTLAGIQDVCNLTMGTSTLDVNVIFVSVDQTADIDAMNFTATTDQTVLNPANGADANLNSNPDFNQATFSDPNWNCTPPAPQRDANPNPAIAESFISCFAAGNELPFSAPPAVTFVLATVHYNVVVPGPATATITLNGYSVGDQNGIPLHDCNPPVDPTRCFTATINVLGPPTSTPTPSNTATNTPTDTSTATNTPTVTNTPTPPNTPTNTATPTDTSTPTVTNTPTPSDSDGDGIDDDDELLMGTDPFDPDTDDDLLSDGTEVLVTFTDPLDPDTDNDGLDDGEEVNDEGTNPNVADSDGDGLSDGAEVDTHTTNPLDADSDNDGINDGPEVNTFGTNPNDPDSDDDGLSDLQEIVTGSNPNLADTDGDGLSDGDEVNIHGTSPLLADTDGDGLSDSTEVNTTNTNPNDVDTDNDSLPDGAEVNTHGTDPTDPDTDNDGVNDGGEVNTYNSDPDNPDTDGDTMPDGFEVLNSCLNVLVNDAAADPDGDAVSNVGELGQSTLPCDPDTDNDGFKDLKQTSHDPVNTDPNKDNCIVDANPSQTNADGDFIDLPPTVLFDDLTHPNSDALGDACDGDADNDGLSNSTETGGPPCGSATGPTDPLNRDTDGDRGLDGAECNLGYNPNNAASSPPVVAAGDADSDGLPNFIEGFIGTNPNDADTDNDLSTDGVEFIRYNSNPLVSDTDGDGCSDTKEMASINTDRTVNSLDLQQISQHFGPAGSPNYITGFDVDRSGVINSLDLAFAARVFGNC